MSLDVHLREDPDMIPCPHCGGILEVPGSGNEVYWANITHNLGGMAEAAGIYEHCWCPDEIGVTRAKQLVEPLRKGIELMKADPERFRKFNAKNGWGLYEHFVPWLERYLAACEAHPEARVGASR